MSAATRLVGELDSLPFPARCRRLALAARELDASGELDGVLAELGAGGVHHRRLALDLAKIAGRLDEVLGYLDDEDLGLSLRAITPAVRLGADPALLAERLPVLSAAARNVLYRALRGKGTAAQADAVFAAAAEHLGERDAAAVLPCCSPGVLARELPGLHYAITGWVRIGRRHPQVFLDHINRELDESPPAAHPQLLRGVDAGLATVALADPSGVLAVLERCPREVSLGGTRGGALGRVVGLLTRREPARVLALLLTPGRTAGIPDRRSLWEAIRTLDDASLVRIARTLPPYTIRDLLHQLPPSRRPAIVAGLALDRELIQPSRPADVLDELPAPARHAEAARLAALRWVADDRRLRRMVVTRRPWPEAEPALRRDTHDPDADVRAAAYEHLVRAAALTRDPAIVEELVATIPRLDNDQDLVRAAALIALAHVPPWLFTPAAATTIARLVRTAMTARDRTWNTQYAVRSLVERMLRHGAVTGRREVTDAALAALTAAGDTLPTLELHGLDRDLPRGAEHQVYATLESRLDADRRVDRYSTLFALTRGLGERAWNVSALQERLGAARSARSDHDARTAIELWLAPPRTRDDRVEQVLRADRSTITIPAVARAVSRRRTDLLEDALTKPQHGRFVKRGVRIIPGFEPVYDRWRPEHVDQFRAVVAQLAVAAGVKPHERAHAVRTLGPIPGSAPLVRSLLADPEPMVVHAAISALPHTADPAAGLPVLLARAEGDDAHLALAAARRCARFVPRSRLAEPLGVTRAEGKVTARKESVRLLAALSVPGAADALLATADSPDVHRDVARAIVSAARHLLDDDRIWSMLESASRTEGVATAVLDVAPDALPTRHRARYAALIRTVAEAPAADDALPALHALSGWTRWDGGAGIDLLVGHLTDLRTTTTWRAALHGLLAAARWPGGPAGLVTSGERLLTAAADDDLTDDFDAAADRDRPARRRLAALATGTSDQSYARADLRTVSAELADLIAQRRGPADLAAVFAVAALDWHADAERAERLRAIVARCETAALADWVGSRLVESVQPALRTLDASALTGAARTLAAEPGPSGPILALHLARVCGNHVGWPAEWRAVVRGLRRHEHPDVRLAAETTVTARE